MQLVRQKYSSGLRVKKLLRFLGLPFATHWPVVAPILKDKIARARRAGDIEEAAHWFEIKSFLWRNLNCECACGTIIGPKRRRCGACESPYRGFRAHARKAKSE